MNPNDNVFISSVRRINHEPHEKGLRYIRSYEDPKFSMN